jgi:hypothetical protein
VAEVAVKAEGRAVASGPDAMGPERKAVPVRTGSPEASAEEI